MLPKDVNMLLSYINTGLRDDYDDLFDMASGEGFDAHDVEEKLKTAGYIYRRDLNRFIRE